MAISPLLLSPPDSGPRLLGPCNKAITPQAFLPSRVPPACGYIPHPRPSKDVVVARQTASRQPPGQRAAPHDGSHRGDVGDVSAACETVEAWGLLPVIGTRWYASPSSTGWLATARSVGFQEGQAASLPLKSRIFSKIRPYDNCVSLRKGTSRFSPYFSVKLSCISYVVGPSVCGPTCAT
jgi:hypothetical protein